LVNLKTKKKGFTIIELLLALSLSGIVLSIFFSFFMTHEDALNKTQKRSELQMDTQLLTEYFSKSAMEASKISKIDSLASEASISTFSGTYQLTSGITFYVDPTLSYVFTISGKRISYHKEENSLSSAEHEISKEVGTIKITPVGVGVGNVGVSNFSTCKGIQVDINLVSDDGKVTYSTTNSMFFRNKK